MGPRSCSPFSEALEKGSHKVELLEAHGHENWAGWCRDERQEWDPKGWRGGRGGGTSPELIPHPEEGLVWGE